MENGRKIFTNIILNSEEMCEQLFALYLLVDDVDVGLIDKVLLQAWDIGVIKLHHCIDFVEGQVFVLLDPVVDLDDPLNA